MAINNVSGFPGPQAQRAGEGSQVQVNRSEPTGNQQETGRPSTVDTVSLTDTAARLRGLENTIASLPVVDSQRVESIQQAMINGTFEIDPQQIAAKMMELESE